MSRLAFKIHCSVICFLRTFCTDSWFWERKRARRNAETATCMKKNKEMLTDLWWDELSQVMFIKCYSHKCDILL